MAHEFQGDIDAVNRIKSVPTILNVVGYTTGMGFAAVARITAERWIACQVKDQIAFGLAPGDELKAEAAIRHEIWQNPKPIAIDNVDEVDDRRGRYATLECGFQSYISTPIILEGGEFFGSLCAIDSKPARVNNPGVIGMFSLFSELIACRLDATDRDGPRPALSRQSDRRAEFLDRFVGARVSHFDGFAGPDAINSHADEVQMLLDQLEDSARRGRGVVLSSRFRQILALAIEAQREAAEQGLSPIGHLFRIVVVDHDSEAHEVIAQAADLMLAKAIFHAAVDRGPFYKIRLYEGRRLILEATGRQNQ